MVVVGNKCDVEAERHAVTERKAAATCADNGLPHFHVRMMPGPPRPACPAPLHAVRLKFVVDLCACSLPAPDAYVNRLAPRPATTSTRRS